MMNPKIYGLFFVALTCIFLQPTALASDKSLCDVVALNGTGTLLEGSRLVGTETLSVIGTNETIPVTFTMETLGTIEVDQVTGGVTLATSHDFKGANRRRVTFTTFDEVTVVPLGGSDPTCTQNACGLIFKLKLETGAGRYNCGEIVSGFNPDPSALIPFTSYVNPLTPAPNGDTVFLNSLGKLCKCSGNN